MLMTTTKRREGGMRRKRQFEMCVSLLSMYSPNTFNTRSPFAYVFAGILAPGEPRRTTPRKQGREDEITKDDIANTFTQQHRHTDTLTNGQKVHPSNDIHNTHSHMAI